MNKPVNDQMHTALAVLLKQQPPPRKMGEQRPLNPSADGISRYLTPYKPDPFRRRDRPGRPIDFSQVEVEDFITKLPTPTLAEPPEINGNLASEPLPKPIDLQPDMEESMSQAAPIPIIQPPIDPTNWRSVLKASQEDPHLLEPLNRVVSEDELEQLTRPDSGITFREVSEAEPVHALETVSDSPIVPPAPPDLSWLNREGPFSPQLRSMSGPARDRISIIAGENENLRKQIGSLEAQKVNIDRQILVMKEAMENNCKHHRELDNYLAACALLAEQSASIENLFVSPKLHRRAAPQRTREAPARAPEPEHVPATKQQEVATREPVPVLRRKYMKFPVENTYGVEDCRKFFLDNPLGNYSGREVAAAAPATKRASAKKYVSQRLAELYRAKWLIRVDLGVYRRIPNARPN